MGDQSFLIIDTYLKFSFEFCFNERLKKYLFKRKEKT